MRPGSLLNQLFPRSFGVLLGSLVRGLEQIQPRTLGAERLAAGATVLIFTTCILTVRTAQMIVMDRFHRFVPAKFAHRNPFCVALAKRQRVIEL